MGSSQELKGRMEEIDRQRKELSSEYVRLEDDLLRAEEREASESLVGKWVKNPADGDVMIRVDSVEGIRNGPSCFVVLRGPSITFDDYGLKEAGLHVDALDYIHVAAGDVCKVEVVDASQRLSEVRSKQDRLLGIVKPG